VDFQADLCWGRGFSVLIHTFPPPREGEPATVQRLESTVVPVADLLPYLTEIARPEGREDTVDPGERPAAMAARAVRKRFDLDYALGRMNLELQTESDGTD
jgi:hypothetical protein